MTPPFGLDVEDWELEGVAVSDLAFAFAVAPGVVLVPEVPLFRVVEVEPVGVLVVVVWELEGFVAVDVLLSVW